MAEIAWGGVGLCQECEMELGPSHAVSLPLVGRDAEQGLASAKAVVRQGGGVGQGHPTRPGCAGLPLPFGHSPQGLLASGRATGATSGRL